MKTDAAGLIPAAGRATRLGSPTGSKEILPVWLPPDGIEPLPVIRCLLSSLEAAGVSRTCIAIRGGKADIRQALGDSTAGGMTLDYVDVGKTPSPPFTVARALPALPEANIVMGFPDLLFDQPGPPGAVAAELAGAEGADVVLGLFPHPESRRADVVDVSESGRIASVSRSGAPVAGTWTWGLAAWTPRFSRFLIDAVEELAPDPAAATGFDFAHLFQAAQDCGLRIGSCVVSERPFVDVGTPDGLAEALRRLEEGRGG